MKRYHIRVRGRLDDEIDSLGLMTALEEFEFVTHTHVIWHPTSTGELLVTHFLNTTVECEINLDSVGDATVFLERLFAQEVERFAPMVWVITEMTTPM